MDDLHQREHHSRTRDTYWGLLPDPARDKQPIRRDERGKSHQDGQIFQAFSEAHEVRHEETHRDHGNDSKRAVQRET